MATLSIRQTLDSILGGRIRVPSFQRGFVWDPDRVAYLMDSLYKGYPIGTILLWRTKSELRAERRLGPYELPPRDPDYPIDYVLDGQQRLTSVFGVFQTELEPVADESWLPIYFDFTADRNAQEPLFFALPSKEADPARYFPLRTLFDSAKFREATSQIDGDVVARIDDVHARFKEVQLAVDTFETDDRASVGIVFERVNRMGVELDTLQLLSAWTWSDDFDLQNRFKDLADTLAPFGFSGVGEDTNLLLRCCAAVVASDASPEALVNLNGAQVRAKFDEIESGIQGAIDFLKSNVNAHSLSALPYSAVIVPLTVFFARQPNADVRISDEQRRELLRWFWRSCFSKRFSSGVLRNLQADIAAMKELANGRLGVLGNFNTSVEPGFFLGNRFITGTVNTKTFVLMLAQATPLSFVSGQPVALTVVLKNYNRSEFHHLYPQAYLREIGRDADDANRLANFAFMSSADNRILAGVSPSKYKARMTGDIHAILASALTPQSLFDDDYDAFKEERARTLSDFAKQLIA